MRELMHSLRRTNPSPCTQHEVYETPVADRTIIMRDPNLVWVGRVLIIRTNGLHSMARSCGPAVMLISEESRPGPGPSFLGGLRSKSRGAVEVDTTGANKGARGISARSNTSSNGHNIRTCIRKNNNKPNMNNHDSHSYVKQSRAQHTVYITHTCCKHKATCNAHITLTLHACMSVLRSRRRSQHNNNKGIATKISFPATEATKQKQLNINNRSNTHTHCRTWDRGDGGIRNQSIPTRSLDASLETMLQSI
jgi:hypothetical protein